MTKKVKKVTSKKKLVNATAKEIREYNKIDTVAKAKQFKKDNKPAPLAGNRKVTKTKRKINRTIVKQTKKITKKKK